MCVREVICTIRPNLATMPSLCRRCKCNQALIMGFGDNEQPIRELMRFIEMTSRRIIREDVVHNGGASITKGDVIKLKRRFIYFYILELSIGKAIL